MTNPLRKAAEAAVEALAEMLEEYAGRDGDNDAIVPGDVQPPLIRKSMASLADLLAALEAGESGGLADHKWLDPECGVHGCQSLAWKSRYEAAINGRRDFRKAFKGQRDAVAARDEALGQAADRLDNFIAAMSLPIPDAIHMKALRSGLPEVASDLRKALALPTPPKE